ncbi:hypothetical protein A2697_04890 [Candidatus Curtissbacteria bacterium RIFCSPHIGHO2_01_FULL_41_44]|uniref:Uncharacterized protein n=1 Tax=Candidatus Curtissbacteria bacterium RIFCSPLOWO2_01_FULL_42_50 TaxID=1797730 RepID=A0A1F5H685_9BACT|nr:MAG: hypothetical protein A3C33_00340 [Candidatus Curtissbacteria bacterium RIFCSPHIGHO2_02_FULL_42_58]OGD93980.1 MAG: hypothetical protein A2697_04890 [Candidatus Curtissbacteria bacterium RIFCSPHIGHO2_01_FULL_41_44]OGD97586.1 MAG: hypothetical protein A3E71_05195 [Candidatus Curtissbacteria bacterium RIFCSPHIGHO2_12_FULL_42_33]OGD99578.1 MAG: hypothetical protein A3B54_02400 [Candidatus Curtissbacteria bacterium RIFCSPLOWO2_01_FULL_42_50]OGE02558.1 MAG: hypothetical protein A3G16_03450 [Ca
MEQHPVPQHIASFEFKLFGNLTVRQFITLAIPLSVAALIFFSPLAPILKIPASLIFAVLGFIAALVPFGGRPLDKWLVAFIRSVLSPTLRTWIKESKTPEFLNVVTSAPLPEKHPPETTTAQGRSRLLAYLRSLPKGQVAPLDVKEQIALQRLELQEYGQVPKGKLPAPILFYSEALPQIKAVPQLTLAQTPPMPESLPSTKPPIMFSPRTSVKISSHAKPYVLPGLETKLGPGHAGPVELLMLSDSTPKEEETKNPRHLASDINFSQEFVIPIKTPDKRLAFLPPVGKTRVRKLHFAPPVDFDLSKLPVRGERRFEISEELKKRFRFPETTEPITNEPQPKPAKGNQPPVWTGPSHQATTTSFEKHTQRAAHAKQAYFVPKPNQRPAPQNASFKQQEVIADSKISIVGQNPNVTSIAAGLGKAKIIPLTTNPNTLSGQATSGKDNTPIVGAIIIVRDENGIPVRALKTNKLGQFLSVTSLANGKYSVEIESEQAHFEPFTINLEGQILAPLEVKAKD